MSQLEQVAGTVNAQMRYALTKILKSKGEHVTDAEIAEAIKRVSRVAVTSTTQANGYALATAQAVDKFNRRDVRRAIGIDVPEYSSPLGEKWRREHIALIKSISEDAKKRFAGILREASQRQTRVETIARALEEQEGITHRRARLIARDQVLTLNAKLNADRHKKAGIEEYEWLTVRDGSVRGNHSHLHGKRFRYDDPPMGGGTSKNERGNPGDGIGCRCQAIPVIPEFEEPPPKAKTAKPPTKAQQQADPTPASRPRRTSPVVPVPAPVVSPAVAQHLPVAPAKVPPPPVSLQSLPVADAPARTAPPRAVRQVSDQVHGIATTEEVDAIDKFTGQAYRAIREAENNNDPRFVAERKYSENIQKLLAKAEADGHAYQGTVYRGLADVDEATVKQFAAEGNIIGMRGTASSSTSLSIAEGFASLDRDFANPQSNTIIEDQTLSGWSVVFVAQNKRGIPIMTMSSVGVHENEVLQPKDAKFKVLRSYRPPGTTRVLYVELEGL